VTTGHRPDGPLRKGEDRRVPELLAEHAVQGQLFIRYMSMCRVLNPFGHRPGDPSLPLTDSDTALEPNRNAGGGCRIGVLLR